MHSNRSFFEEKKNNLEQSINILEQQGRRYSIFRLIVFLLFIIPIVLFFNRINTILACILFCLITAVFIFLCIKHGQIKNNLDRFKAELQITCEFLARIDGDYSFCKDSGSDYIDYEHDYSSDLDVFGDVSLYTRFCLAETKMGKDLFAINLTQNHDKQLSSEELIKRQNAVKELISKPNSVVEFQAVSRNAGIRTFPQAIINFSSGEGSVKSSHKILPKISIAIWVIALVLSFVFPKFSTACVFFPIILNLVVFASVSGKYSDLLKSIDKISIQCTKFKNIFEKLESITYEDEYLKEIIKGGSSDKASVGLSELSKACFLVSFRSQPLLALILNLIIPFDIMCASKLYSWKNKYSDEFDRDIKSVSLFEVLISCACVGLVSNESSFPVITDKVEFSGVDIYHPLLNPNTVVSNSITFGSDTVIITGSNMSGKTTLIRTVGISCILAYMGAPVTAQSATVGRMHILSSMRITDSVGGNMSTFKAELVRIGKIIDFSRNGKPMLFLIDEIFRGTNSTDRTEGALTVLNNLYKDYIAGMMTTHDYALCDKIIESDKKYLYYYFSEKYNDTGIYFDYKLNSGISRQSNAKYLMRLVGIDS